MDAIEIFAVDAEREKLDTGEECEDRGEERKAGDRDAMEDVDASTESALSASSSIHVRAAQDEQVRALQDKSPSR